MNALNIYAKSLLSIFLSSEQLTRLGSAWIDRLTILRYLLSCRKSVKKLKEYKDKHKGERCFIIGNGPSLNQMDLSVLRDEFTFGLNRIYLLFDKLGFETTYYVSVNQYVIEQCAQDIMELKCPKFIKWNSRHFVKDDPNAIFVWDRCTPIFSSNIPEDGVWEGATVTYVAMQLAYYMGFSEVVLIGIDHSFKTKGEPHRLVLSESSDENHFHPEYFGKGFKWQLPDLDTSEKAYGMAKEAYEKANRKIIDATVGGKLTIFPKVRFEELFKQSLIT